MKSGDIYEQAVVKPVPSQGSGQALSLSKGRSRDCFAGIPPIDSASPGSGRQESTYGNLGGYRRGNRWVAEIRCRGKRYHLGRFDDEVEPAKARDRKAYELHGAHAYLNFPEDYRRRRPAQRI